MIGVFVKLQYGAQFDERAVRRVAEASRGRFEGMPGLHSKAFTFDAAKGEATNFYVWESEEAARAFFNAEVIERITRAYGVRPQIDFVQIASLVENARFA